MSWAEIESYVRDRDPGLLQDAQGVPEEDLAAIEASTQKPLPKHYRDCMLSIGGSKVPLRPFGRGWSHEFYALVARPPEPEFLEHGFLRIGLNEDSGAIVEQDIYLDLNQDEDGDAPLVDVETFSDYDPDELEYRGLTFVDQMVRRAFRVCEYDARPETVGLIARVDPTTKEDYVSELVAVLDKLDVRPCLPSSPRMVALNGDGRSVLIESRALKPFVFVDIAADAHLDAGRLAEVLLDNVDGLRRRSPPQDFSES